MTPDELRQLTAAWPSLREFGRDIGVSRATVYHWLGRVRSIPEPCARLARILHDYPELRERVRSDHKQDFGTRADLDGNDGNAPD